VRTKKSFLRKQQQTKNRKPANNDEGLMLARRTSFG